MPTTMTRPMTALQVAAPLDAEVKLVFRKRRSILSGTVHEGGDVWFRAVPTDELVTVVALRFVNGEAELATRDVTVVDNLQLSDLPFRAVTLAALKEEMRKLDQ